LARIVKEPLVRRNEILDAAQRFMFSQGYEQMTIQDILDDLKISKGAFYHYFNSKTELLEALIARLQSEAEQVIIPILQDSQLSSVEKLQRFFDTAGRWKTARKEYLLALVQGWYSPENAVVRQKSEASMLKSMEPLFSELIQQGIREGLMSSSCPGQVGGIIMSLFQGMADPMVQIILSPQPKPEDLMRLDEIAFAYTDSIERLLGITPGTLKLVDHEIMKEWVVLPQETQII